MGEARERPLNNDKYLYFFGTGEHPCKQIALVYLIFSGPF